MRGDVHRLRSNPRSKGREQAGPRYGVVVQSDALHLSTWLIAPTSTSARPAEFRPTVEVLGVPTQVLVEQTVAVDARARVGDYVGRLAPDEMAEVDRALRIALGLF